MRDDPLALIHHLHRHDIPFVVIGGHAVTVHGYPRATEDTDIVFLSRNDSVQPRMDTNRHE